MAKINPNYHAESCVYCGDEYRNQDGVKEYIKMVWQSGNEKADIHREKNPLNWHDKAITIGGMKCSRCGRVNYIQSRFSHENSTMVITTPLFFIHPIEKQKEYKPMTNEKAF